MSPSRELEELARRGARAPAPLLSLDELGGLTDSAVAPAALEERLHSRPDLFRTVNFWRGPLRALTPRRRPLCPAYRDALAEQGLEGRLLVACRRPDSDPFPGDDGPPAERLRRTVRDSVAVVARRADLDSFPRLLRLARLVREEERLRVKLARTEGSRVRTS